jgi:hypothetical protein
MLLEERKNVLVSYIEFHINRTLETRSILYMSRNIIRKWFQSECDSRIDSNNNIRKTIIYVRYLPWPCLLLILLCQNLIKKANANLFMHTPS